MSRVKLGNGASLESYLRGSNAEKTSCDCPGADVGMVLSSLVMAGSNISYIYTGPRCVHNEPIKAAPVAYIVENYYEQSIKVKGKTNIHSWLNQLMRGSVALVFFKSNSSNGGSALDLYLGNKLWINSGVAEEADEMWVWCMGSPVKSLKKQGHKKHKAIHVF